MGITPPYILGLDLGIASVGWALVSVDGNENPMGLIDCGVRTFERAEVPKTGDSLAKARREARSVRRLIRRRAHRMLRLRRLLKREGVLAAADFSDGLPVDMPSEPWVLRVAGLDRKLEAKEWAAVLLHLVKHRGYLSQRKSEMQTEDNELGRLLAGVAENHKLLSGSPNEYRTPAELAVKKFAAEHGHMRNKGGDYTHTFNRLDLQKELHLLFARQRALGNPHVSEHLAAKVDALLMTQRSALQGDAVLKMLGHCTFEPQEYKAAKHTYSAERFVWLTKLNNLRILHKGEERALDERERRLLLDEPYKKAKFTYTQARKLLEMPADAVFKGLRYGKDSDGLKAESGALAEMKAYHKIRVVLEKAGLGKEWENRIRNPELLDAVGTAFSLYKTDDDIAAHLAEFNLPDNVLNALLAGLGFDKFVQLSLKALRNILPLMEQGMRYDEACAAVYGNHYGAKNAEANRLLPHIPINDIRNPVVFRTLTQARKIINAAIRRYGSPQRVHIETARELGKSFKDRREIEKKQEENRKEREHAAADFKELFPNFAGEPKGQDILKMRLYKQQQSTCLYSGAALDLGRLNEKGYAEIDHALPFSRTWDDSFNNKVLVLGSENQKKRNQTPYEYLGGADNSERWREFQARLQGCHFSYGKKQRIQTAKLDSKAEQGFLERNLNDTRYVARFLCNFIEENLHLEGSGKRRVFASNGQITALLRGLWGLVKVREDNDRHHALDAVVVACSTVSMQQKITKAMQRRETLEMVDRESGEVKQRIPQPWDFFRQEVMIRVFSDNPCEELAQKLDSRPQAVHEYVAPLFVSRAPNRKMTGQGHLETVKSAKRLSENISVVKKPLTSLKSKDIENIVGYPDREPALYAALLERLAAHNDDPAKAFAEPFFKPAKDGGQGALVRAVHVEDVQKNISVVKKPLTSLKSKDIENIVGYPDREPALYAALIVRLLKNDDDPKKAFAEDFYKPSKKVDRETYQNLKLTWEKYRYEKETDSSVQYKEFFSDLSYETDPKKYGIRKKICKESDQTVEIKVQPIKSILMQDVQKTGVLVRDGNGIADNATMVRVDVFGKGGKNYLVPVYAWQVAKGILPNRAVVQGKDEVDWDEMDESYAFKFSLYPNDLVEVISKKGRIFGYFASCHRGTGNINIRIHDLDNKIGKNGMLEGVGVKTALSFQKYQVDPLGKEIRLCKAEQRPALKNKK